MCPTTRQRCAPHNDEAPASLPSRGSKVELIVPLSAALRCRREVHRHGPDEPAQPQVNTAAASLIHRQARLGLGVDVVAQVGAELMARSVMFA